MIGETSQEPALVARGNVATNNLIEQCGAQFFEAVGVWAGTEQFVLVFCPDSTTSQSLPLTRAVP